MPRFHFRTEADSSESATALPPAPAATRRRWLAGIGTGMLAAGAAGWFYWRQSRPEEAVIHLHAAGGEASPAGAFRLKLAHQLGRLLPSVELSAAENIQELRAGDGVHPAAAAYALVLCGEAGGAKGRFCVAAEAGGTATEVTPLAALAELDRPGARPGSGTGRSRPRPATISWKC